MSPEIDVVNKSILLCIFLIGFLSGAALASIIHAYIGGKQ